MMRGWCWVWALHTQQQAAWAAFSPAAACNMAHLPASEAGQCFVSSSQRALPSPSARRKEDKLMQQPLAGAATKGSSAEPTSLTLSLQARMDLKRTGQILHSLFYSRFILESERWGEYMINSETQLETIQWYSAYMQKRLNIIAHYKNSFKFSTLTLLSVSHYN